MRRLLLLTALLAAALQFPAIAQEKQAKEDPLVPAIRWLASWAEQELESEAARSPNDAAKTSVTLALTSFLIALDEKNTVDPELARRILDRNIRYARGARAADEDALENWSQAFCGLALIERALRGAKDGDALDALVARIQAGQLADGGWGHGFKGAISSYPSTLIASTNGLLFVLGMCERIGLEIDEDRVEDALELYESVQAESGAFPYGGPYHRVSFEAGRTAGALTAMTALGRTDEEVLRCTADYLFVNVEAIANGHGSPAYHVFNGALAFHALGPEAWLRYHDVVLSHVLAVRRGDGSYGDIFAHSPDSLAVMGPEELNTAYRTALYAAALAIPRSVAAQSLREFGEDRLPVVVTRHEPNDCCLVWNRELEDATHLVSDSGIIAAVEKTGVISFYHAETGLELQSVEHPADCDVPLKVAGVAHRGDKLVVWMTTLREADFDAEVRAAQVFRAGAVPPREKAWFACFSIPEMRVMWNLERDGNPTRVALSENRVFVLDRAGGLSVLALKNGLNLRCLETRGPIVNSALEVHADGSVAVAVESVLRMTDSDGETVWEETRRRKSGITPPSWSALHWTDAGLYAGSTNGVVDLFDAATGERKWSLALHAAVRSLQCPPDQDDLLLALTDDGRVCAISKGELAWESDLASGHEWRGDARWHVDGESIWIAHAGHGRIRVIDLKSGDLESELGLPDGATWTVAADKLFYATGGALISYR